MKLLDLIKKDDWGLHPTLELAQTRYADVVINFLKEAIAGELLLFCCLPSSPLSPALLTPPLPLSPLLSGIKPVAELNILSVD